jgi:hypothetical protein
MKKLFLFLIPAFLLFSCKKDNNNPPDLETTTAGTKWGLKIGSSYADVYAQLQQTAEQNDIQWVDIINQKQTFDKLEDIQSRVKFYSMITIEKGGPTNQTTFIYDTETITGILVPGGDAVDKWPQGASDKTALVKNEPVANLYTKLLAILKKPEYSGYKITLSGKNLKKDYYDPDMGNYKQWSFYISKTPKENVLGQYHVTVTFNSGKLVAIRTEYKESGIYQ